jgi:hypothetical protein
MPISTGTFEPTLTPQSADAEIDLPVITRLKLSKVFAGDLVATGLGHMLAARTAIDHSAGYVAIEQVTGSLQGRTGTFLLQHSGLMNRGDGTLTVSIVPDSGTGELQGLAGKMTIIIGDDGAHRYEIDYTLD